jgi:hypothetical protein
MITAIMSPEARPEYFWSPKNYRKWPVLKEFSVAEMDASPE